MTPNERYRQEKQKREREAELRLLGVSEARYNQLSDVERRELGAISRGLAEYDRLAEHSRMAGSSGAGSPTFRREYAGLRGGGDLEGMTQDYMQTKANVLRYGIGGERLKQMDEGRAKAGPYGYLEGFFQDYSKKLRSGAPTGPSPRTPAGEGSGMGGVSDNDRRFARLMDLKMSSDYAKEYGIGGREAAENYYNSVQNELSLYRDGKAASEWYLKKFGDGVTSPGEIAYNDPNHPRFNKKSESADSSVSPPASPQEPPAIRRRTIPMPAAESSTEYKGPDISGPRPAAEEPKSIFAGPSNPTTPTKPSPEPPLVSEPNPPRQNPQPPLPRPQPQPPLPRPRRVVSPFVPSSPETVRPLDENRPRQPIRQPGVVTQDMIIRGGPRISSGVKGGSNPYRMGVSGANSFAFSAR